MGSPVEVERALLPTAPAAIREGTAVMDKQHGAEDGTGQETREET